jgi:hypothetical protein
MSQQWGSDDLHKVIEWIQVKDKCPAGEHIRLPNDRCHEEHHLHDACHDLGDIPKARAQQAEQESHPNTIDDHKCEGGDAEQQDPSGVLSVPQRNEEEDPYVVKKK